MQDEGVETIQAEKDPLFEGQYQPDDEGPPPVWIDRQGSRIYIRDPVYEEK